MNADVQTIILPQITVQHDISLVIDDVRDGVVGNEWEDIWVSCYHEGRPSVHGKVRISRSNDNPHGVAFEARSGVEWLGTSTAEFRVTCPSLDIQPVSIRLPKHFYPSLRSHTGKKLTAFDISPDGATFAAGYDDGSIVISSPSTSSSPHIIGKPHLSTVLSVRFFPSSVVLLSTSSDHSVKIHDAKLPSTSTENNVSLSTVRSLLAHSAGATGCAIVDRGRNVLSFGRDATARLWNVGEAKEITGRRWRAEKGVPVLCGCIGEKVMDATGGDSRTPLDGEVGTENKLVFAGLQDGSVRGYELKTGRVMFYSSPLSLPYSPPGGDSTFCQPSKPSAIDSIFFDSLSSTLAAGTRNGHILVWHLASKLENTASNPVSQVDESLDVRPDTIIRRNAAGIESLYIVTPNLYTAENSPVHILIGSADGLFCRVRVAPGEGVAILEEYIGVEAGECIRVVKSVGEGERGSIWCAADDGVRRY